MTVNFIIIKSYKNIQILIDKPFSSIKNITNSLNSLNSIFSLWFKSNSSTASLVI